MSVVIPKNTATAALRRIPFTLVDATDLVTPEDITVTGVKVALSFGGGSYANSTNDIVKVDGTSGEYYIELTQSESNTALGIVRGKLTPTGCALTKLEATIGPAEAYDSPSTGAQIADAILARNQQGGSNSTPTVSQALASGLFSITISGGTLTVKHGDGTTAFTRTLTRSALDAIISAV